MLGSLLSGVNGGMGGEMSTASAGPLETRVTSNTIFGGAQQGNSTASVLLIAALVAGVTYYVVKK